MPDSLACLCLLLQFELRYNEVDRARAIFERYIQILPSVKAWVRYAKFEMKNGEVALARRTYERAVEELGEDAQTVRDAEPTSRQFTLCLLLQSFGSAGYQGQGTG